MFLGLVHVHAHRKSHVTIVAYERIGKKFMSKKGVDREEIESFAKFDIVLDCLCYRLVKHTMAGIE